MIAFRSGVSRLNKVVKAFEKAASELELAQTQIQEEINKSFVRTDKKYEEYIVMLNEEVAKRDVLHDAKARAATVYHNLLSLVGA